MNGDGKLDLAVPSLEGLGVLVGSGNGTFSVGAIYGQLGAAYDAKTTDVNGDGLTDIVFTSSSGLAVMLGQPVISIIGTATEDQVLTASNTLADADGMGVVSYQWQRNGSNIVGATGSTYTLGDADVDASIRVVASYTDGRGTAESVTSAAAEPVANVNDAPTGTVSISGAVTEDPVLTASNTLADADSMGAISYQWQRNGSNIVGATGSTYTLGDADVGASMRVVVSYTDGHGTAESVASAAVGPVALVGDNANDGGLAVNYLYGATGNDTLIGGSASNWSFAFNYLYGGTGDDTLSGGSSSNGGYVENYLYGGDGSDTLTGGSTAQTNELRAGTGNDTLIGGDNAPNSFFLDDLGVGDHVHGVGSSNWLGAYGTSGDDSLVITNGVFVLNGSSLDITGIQYFLYNADNGNDVIDASESGLASVTLNGGSGNDTVIGAGSLFILDDLGVGDHVHGVGSSNRLETNGTSGDDNLMITNGIFVLNGSSLDITGIQAFRYLAGDGDDVIDARQSGLTHVVLSGGTGNDTLSGGDTFGSLAGEGGNDTLIASCSTNGGVVANNILGGGSGSDTFVFNFGSGTSEITDFTAGSGSDHDVVDISAYGFQSLDQVVASTTDFAGYCVIQLDSTNTLALQRVHPTTFTADNFIL